MPNRKGPVSTTGLAVADQIVSSITNLGVSLIAARSLSTAEFGAFSVIFLCYVLSVGIAKAICAEPLTVRYDITRAADRSAQLACGSSIGLGLVFSASLALAGFVLPSPFKTLTLAMAAVLPGLLLQNTIRFVYFSRGEPARALGNDIVWLFTVILGLGLTALLGMQGAAQYVVLWGLGANLAALYGMVRGEITLAFGGGWRWIRLQRDLSLPFLAEYIAVQGSSQVALYTVGWIAGLGALGIVRGAQLLYGPINIVFAALGQLMLPELGRILRRSHQSFSRATRAITVLLIGVGAINGLVLLWIPSYLGEGLLGQTWAGARDLIPAFAVDKMAMGAAAGAFCGLRLFQRVHLSLSIRVVIGFSTVTFGAFGAWHAGAVGAAWGMAAAQGIGAAMYWFGYRRAERCRLDAGAEQLLTV